MATVSSTVGMRAVTQAAWQQMRVRQAQRDAERAELTAQALRAEANAAQYEADRAQENARSLYASSDRARAIAGQARQGLAAIESVAQMQTSLVRTAEQASERQATARQTTTAAPVVNTSGQMTGTVVSTVA